MRSITFTLVSDGSSDQALIPILQWLLAEHLPNIALNPYWADFRQLVNPPRALAERIQCALELYPCDVLFVHRDAERSSIKQRASEIDAAVAQLSISTPIIKVIPVRMTEAWLLIEEEAIRRAAGNPRGRSSLQMPRLHQLENLADPKSLLADLLRTASELKGRRLKKFDPDRAKRLIPSFITDFGKLRQLSAFQQLEQDVCAWKKRI